MKPPTRKSSKLAKGLNAGPVASVVIPAATASGPKNDRSISGIGTAAAPNAERRKRTCACSSKAISFRISCCSGVSARHRSCVAQGDRADFRERRSRAGRNVRSRRALRPSPHKDRTVLPDTPDSKRSSGCPHPWASPEWVSASGSVLDWRRTSSSASVMVNAAVAPAEAPTPTTNLRRETARFNEHRQFVHGYLRSECENVSCCWGFAGKTPPLIQPLTSTTPEIRSQMF